MLAQNDTFYLVDIDTKVDVDFRNLIDKYHLNKENPTIMVLWSNKWCTAVCTDLIDRYAMSDLSKFNLLLVNVDIVGPKKYVYYETNDELYQDLKATKRHWNKQNVASFYGYSKKGGIELAMGDSVRKTPHIIFLDKDMKAKVSQTWTQLNPNVLFDYIYKDQSLPIYKASPEDVIDHFKSMVENDTIDVSIITKSIDLMDQSFEQTKEPIFASYFYYKLDERDKAEISFKYNYTYALYYDRLGKTNLRNLLIAEGLQIAEKGDLPMYDSYKKDIERLKKLKGD